MLAAGPADYPESLKAGRTRSPPGRGGRPGRPPGEVTAGFTRTRFSGPRRKIPAAEGGVFSRVSGLLRDLSEGVHGTLNIEKLMKKQLSRGGVVLCRRSLVMPMRAEIIEQVLVKVNGDIITKTELEQRQVAALRAADAGSRSIPKR